MKRSAKQRGKRGPDETSVLFGTNAKKHREAQGRTVADVAASAGISRAYLIKLEHGQANPDALLAVEIGRALGVQWQILIGYPPIELSAAALEAGRLFDEASDEARDALLGVLRALKRAPGAPEVAPPRDAARVRSPPRLDVGGAFFWRST